MQDLNINYAYHYNTWHTEESREADIAYYAGYLANHHLLPKEKGAAILEIGCGMGNLLLALRAAGYENLAGIDIDKAQVEASQKHGLNVQLSGALEYLQGCERAYDSIFLLDVLEHMDKPEQLKLLRLIHSALRPGGRLVLTVPNAMAPLGLYFENIDWTHYCSFSPTSLAFVLKNGGFHNFAFRPTHRETKEVRALKAPWINLYRAEFGFREPILTPSVMAVCFENKGDLETYLREAPDLLSPVTNGSAGPLTVGLRLSKKVVKKALKTLKILP